MTKNRLLWLNNGIFDLETMTLTEAWWPGAAWDPQAKARFPEELERHLGGEPAAYIQDWLRRAVLGESPEPIHIPGGGFDAFVNMLGDTLGQTFREQFMMVDYQLDQKLDPSDGRAVIITGWSAPEGVRWFDLDWYSPTWTKAEMSGILRWIVTPGPLALNRVKSTLLR